MRFWSKYWTLSLLVLIGALLPVLAFLQYHWLDELSRLEQQHRSDNLRAAAVRFSVELDAEFARLYQALHVRQDALADAASAMTERYREWAASVPHADLVDAVYWVEAFEEQEPRIRKVDFSKGRFLDVDWPPELEGMREAFSTPGTIDPLQPDVPAVVVFQHGTESLPWAVVVLDSAIMYGPFLAERVEQFSGGSPIDYDVVIADIQNQEQVLYASSPHLSARELVNYEATASIGFFGLHTRDFRFDWIEALPTAATEHRWRLYIRHQPGALEAAVGAMRARNVLVSFGILLILGGSILLLLMSTRRAQRWARLQLEYVARIAHELRTPLAVIGFASENLADEVVSDLSKARTYGQIINKESRRLTKLVESALLHSKLESGTATDMERQPIQIAELIESALRDSEISGMDVRRDLAEELPAVMGDGEALKSALLNLFSNALKYSGKPCRLTVSAKETESKHGAAVEIEIEDRGPGIPPADLPHIFEPFYRGSVARDEQIEGSGIGLSLVKHVVDAHGGTISVTSPDSGGSRFTLLLPASA